VPGEFHRREDAYVAARPCAAADAACLDDWMQVPGRTFAYVYLVKGKADDCCAPLRQALRSDPRYTVAYDGPGATIFARRAS
jgi:hypothetical protein